ncbi:MAG: undecaprenyl/decaprenyl-phosphate alpha-N-acetylglucosaminyl 1-phosphate transferase [Chloroflexi bacterium]|nr:undecaprenyl/decaprenyl-phosphate alpha-N-acetylglucosaminyl 1-phosphate transferase [Chloroflexota bacterium]
MVTLVVIFLAALAFAVGATPVARRVAVLIGVVDRPDPRKLHARTMPLLGGLAIYAACVLAVLVFGDREFVPQLVGILVGASLVSFLGVWDDRWGLRPFLKLFGQAVAAVIVVASGVQVEFLHHPIANLVATVFWIVAITNAMNLLDNMDGLSGGIAAVASAFFFLLAAGSGQFLVASLSAAVLGACLGFLRYNFNPATIFMGDTGSLFLGFILSIIAIKLRFGNLDIITWMVPVLVLGVPIFDTTLVVISRLRKGVNPLTTPGKDHVSHRLVALGWTQREAVMVLYLTCGALGMAAMFISKATIVEAIIVGGLVLIGAIITLVKLEQVVVAGARQ